MWMWVWCWLDSTKQGAAELVQLVISMPSTALMSGI